MARGDNSVAASHDCCGFRVDFEGTGAEIFDIEVSMYFKTTNARVAFD